MWDKWVIDATPPYSPGDGVYCFIPVEGELGSGNESFVTGMNVVSDKPPHDGEVVGIIHEGGQDAVEAFCKAESAHLTELGFAEDRQ